MGDHGNVERLAQAEREMLSLRRERDALVHAIQTALPYLRQSLHTLERERAIEILSAAVGPEAKS